MKLRILISYNGAAYCGWQYQPNGVSVQQKLNEAAKAVFGVDCDIVGCSRTDSGVHAYAFCATVSEKGKGSLATSVPIERIPLALTAYLPLDIAVFFAEWVEEDFHARYGVLKKEYIYRFYNRPVRDPFEEGRSCHIPRPIDEEGIRRMNEAAQFLCGTQDFVSYMAGGSSVQSTVRTVYEAAVTKEGNIILFRISADGFLYNMVRILAGTLLLVGQGKLEPDDVVRITQAKNRVEAGSTMPACGLYLNRVFYPDLIK